jgi:RHS repeat-associated protein
VGAAGGAAQINWLITDHLGTPRMIADQTGSLVGIKRHDYLPFGEEIGAGVGGRTTGQGYSQPSGIRQGFTGYEKDGETGLDYAQNRYYSNVQGRFTSVDPENTGANLADPQSWNGYSYVSNNPLRFVDPNGLSLTCRKDGKIVSCEYALNQIRQGNFESLTYTNTTGVSLTVRRADFYTATSSTRADGTEVITTTFNQSGFLQAAGNFAGFLQQSIERNELDAGASRGFGGGRDYGGSGSGGSCPSCPAFNDDPYNPKVVEGRQNARNTGNTQTPAEAAKHLGFTRVVRNPPFNAHGQKVFTDGSGRYITRDADSHRGGVWKMFNRSGERLGTYDANLKRIGN